MKMKYLKRFNESNEIDSVVSYIEDILLPIKDMDYNVGVTNSIYNKNIFIRINNGETKYFLIDENIRETLAQLSDYINDLGLNMNINLFSRGKGLEKSFERSFTDVYRIPKYTYVSNIFINVGDLHKLETEEEVIESILYNDLNQNIKDVENILLDFTDNDIPVEVYDNMLSVRGGGKKNSIFASIGEDDPDYPFELNNELIQTIKQMNDYFESEGFELEEVYFLKAFEVESIDGKPVENRTPMYPESKIFDNIGDFLKFAVDNINTITEKAKGRGRERKIKLKYTLIEFCYTLK